ncbi:MAG TPA: ATP-binding protein [Tepidisphaeraceae bacterium]|nr:ATP-binding protein [Tepidisphaeraceae bacterium]
MKASLEKKVLAGLGLASVLVAGVTVAYYVGMGRVIASSGQVNQSHALISALAHLSTRVQRVQMSTRGYLFTGDPALRAAHAEAREQVAQALAAVRDAAQSHPECLQHAEEITLLVRERLSSFQNFFTLSDRFGRQAAGLVAVTGYRQDVADPLIERIEHLIGDARTMLAHDEDRSTRWHRRMLWLLIACAAVEITCALAAAYVIRRDLRQRRRAADELRASEATLRGFYDSGVTAMGIAEIVGNDIVVVSANAMTASLYGRPAAQLVGRRISNLGAPPEVTRLYIEKYDEARRRGAAAQFQYGRRTPLGERWFSAAVCPIASPGAARRFSYVLLDETDRRAAEVALRQHIEQLAQAKATLEKQSAALAEARDQADAASRAKSQFLANMSHEIRTPMTAILGYADLLADPATGDAQRQQWTGVVRRNARHLLELINGILDLSKIESGRMTLESVWCDPAQIVGDVVETLRPRAVEKGLSLRLDFEGAAPRRTTSDPLRLRQVLLNLVGNAVKFTEAGEVLVRVTSDPADGTLQFEVRDTGIGISAEELARLFRPFTQADESTTRRFGGTGLGLAITRRLVAMLNGTLEVSSEVGIGTTFRVTLPVRTADAAAAPPAEGSAEAEIYAGAGEVAPTRLRGSILLAEDAPDTQRLLSVLLGSAGADVTLVGNGRAAVDAASARPFDLVVMDMQMPEMDGYAATAEMRRRGVTAPVIALTANARASDRDRCLGAGCDDYLTKPLDVPLLMRRVQHHLGPRAAPDPLAAA